MSRIVGYARTSTLDQRAGLEAQVRDLRAAGCEEIFSEQVSSVGERAELDRVLASMGAGDKLVVTKIDRLARNIRGLCEIVDGLEAKGAGLRILSMALDTSTPTGRLMLNVLGSVAQFEREIMLERQAEGITKAQADGKYRGRPRGRAIEAAAIRALLADGQTIPQIALGAGVSRVTIYQTLRRGSELAPRETTVPRLADAVFMRCI